MMNKTLKSCLKWGFIGMGVYIFCVVINLAGWMIGSPFADKHPDFFPPGSLSFLIPLMVISFYPGLFIAGNYENLGIIIPVNILFYFLLGGAIGYIKSKKTII